MPAKTLDRGTQEIYRTVQQSFSGYVHGAYPHIMESYGGSPSNLHYHMNGMLGTTRIPEWTETLLTYIYRTMIAVEVVAKRCDDAEALTAIRATRLALEQATGVGLDDPRELLAQSKRK